MAQQVYTLLVEVGRAAGDGLPEGSTGAGLVCYASGGTQDEAVRETIAVLKQADLAPLEVQAYGTLDERLAEGHEIPDEERALMTRALDENAVIVAQMEPFFPGD
ncbi:hypothetical protein [Paracoccus aeridis]|uniref:hypothetical protein n=1 Tax=Paracoccus aeridis TaxID=1966466 RepID=UPI0010AB21E8|nr:hypothetical protein [Paracoccus aeridis]